MTVEEMHVGFKMEMDKSTSLELPAFETEEIDFWLNVAIRQFVKNKFLGTDKGVGFEEVTKRIMDLSTLVVEDTLTYKTTTELVNGTVKDDSFVADLSQCSEDVWFIVGEEVNIGYMSLSDSTTSVTSGNLVSGNCYKVTSSTITHDGTSYSNGEYFIATTTTFTGGGTVALSSNRKQGITNCSVNTYRSHIDNPYSEHNLHYEEAKPLRLVYQRYIELVTDGNYGILSYHIRYLKEPGEVDYGTSADSDLPEHTHDEVVKLAANMALENVEQPRYQSHQIELNKVE